MNRTGSKADVQILGPVWQGVKVSRYIKRVNIDIYLQEHFNCYTLDENVGPVVLSFKEEPTSENNSQIRAILR